MANRRPRRRGGRPKGRAELNYVGIRTLMSNNIYLDERFDQMLKMALTKRFGENSAETLATLKLTGFLEQMKKGLVYRATREDYKRLWMEAEKQRFDKKFALTKAEAVARFFSGKKPQSIKDRRPLDFEAKPGTMYYPRPGSAEGKVEVKQIGAQKTLKKIEKTFWKLFTMFDGMKNVKNVKPSASVRRSFIKSINIPND